MLKQRVITALILAAALIAAVYFLPLIYFAAFIGVFFAIAAWEWAQLAHLAGAGRWGYATALAIVSAACAWWAGLGAELLAERVLVFAAAAGAWWLLAVYLVKRYPRGTQLWARHWQQALIGALVILPAWLSLVFLRSEPLGAWLILILVVSVVCADTGAYFVGRQWGRRKLAPAVSPGKSREGFLGGFASSVLFALILIFSLGREADWWLLVLIVPASLASVLGDLLESMLKRERGIKDSGRILPGHGGILDRIDSITAAAPVFTLGYILSGWQL